MTPTPKQFIREILRIHTGYKTDVKQMARVIGASGMMRRVLPRLKPGLVALENQLIKKYIPLVAKKVHRGGRRDR